ncbi:MAG: dTDP-4-dehydrorhamnose reductase family protein, partial [Legionellaceae bacterium]
MKKILILGVSGMLGHSLYRYLSEKTNVEVYGTLRHPVNKGHFSEAIQANLITHVDVLNQDGLIALFNTVKPDVVINCVGLVKQLPNAHDPLAVLPINSLLPHRLAQLSALMGARFIQISTDCVFSGKKGLYTEEDVCDATDLYGVSKKIGEVTDLSNALTLRAPFIGRELTSCYALIDWFLSQKNTVQGYTGAIYSGLPTVELARVIHEYVLPFDDLSGLYHVSSEPIDKYTLLKLVAEIYGKSIEIIPEHQFKMDRS